MGIVIPLAKARGKPLYVYLLTQSEIDHHGSYTKCVVVEESEDRARRVHPCQDRFAARELDRMWRSNSILKRWATDPDNVAVQLLGPFEGERPESPVICAQDRGER